MVEEARLEEREGGLTPVSGGWFVVNVRDGAWVTNRTLGDVFIVEGDDAPFPDIGFSLAVFQPGQASRYHREANQEDFLVLAGECLLLIEGEERPLKAWDFVHCPPWTEHIFVGAGDGPCVVVGVGARRKGRGIVYPVNETALRHGAGVDDETSDPRVAYARFAEDTPVSGHEVFPG
jgi:uncharacterized cupin superfamily protein